jgi:ABC-2 type transport system ATP-binding protein
MQRGELVACGTMEELRQASGRDDALEDIFLRLTGDEMARALVDVLDA